MKIALVGNPNTGKTTLFNKLTGLNQKVGNYPGITVDKKVGYFKLESGKNIQLIDLPGTYSLNASAKDEEIVTEALSNKNFIEYPEAVIVVADATNLKRNLLLFTQVLDLKLPCVLVLNMSDVAIKRGIDVDVLKMAQKFGVPVVSINARKGLGVDELKSVLEKPLSPPVQQVFKPLEINAEFVEKAKSVLHSDSNYSAWLIANTPNFAFITEHEEQELNKIRKALNINTQRNKVSETVARYGFIDNIIKECVSKKETKYSSFTGKLDAILTHKIWGFFIFIAILLLIFQAIFSWSEWPMELIDNLFGTASTWVLSVFPEGPVANLLADGIIPGIAGVVIFIPQIAILFAFIALLEETGYMSRVVYIMDKIMRQFGLNGKSVVPLLSGMACAIPAVMATRSISNFKERLITILVTPFMTCSARLPVYTILIALVIPNTKYFGFMNLQGMVLLSLYLFGFVMAILSAVVFNKILKSAHVSQLIMEMPPYKVPHWRNVILTIVEKVKSFVFTAGKIIVAISIVLWALASYGPGNRREVAIQQIEVQAADNNWNEETKNLHLMSAKLENSYMGIFGKSIEPVIKPLGYDWKIGIALIASFAAREVFVGTMATIYSVGEEGDPAQGVKAQMAKDVDLETNQPRFTFAVAVSLLIFYALAMQCMSTIAVVYRETKGWKWPLIQFGFMTGLAYLLSFLAYQFLK